MSDLSQRLRRGGQLMLLIVTCWTVHDHPRIAVTACSLGYAWVLWGMRK